jgi:hypothetical protein
MHDKRKGTGRGMEQFHASSTCERKSLGRGEVGYEMRKRAWVAFEISFRGPEDDVSVETEKASKSG